MVYNGKSYWKWMIWVPTPILGNLHTYIGDILLCPHGLVWTCVPFCRASWLHLLKSGQFPRVRGECATALGNKQRWPTYGNPSLQSFQEKTGPSRTLIFERTLPQRYSHFALELPRFLLLVKTSWTAFRSNGGSGPQNCCRDVPS